MHACAHDKYWLAPTRKSLQQNLRGGGSVKIKFKIVNKITLQALAPYRLRRQLRNEHRLYSGGYASALPRTPRPRKRRGTRAP